MQESAAHPIDVSRALTTVLMNPAATASRPTMTDPQVNGAADWAGACSDPVFVLCCGRSGSTLLRFLLDAHPDLACPPETNVATLCAHLASVWSLLAGAPIPADLQ